jgi:hypothetical protein
MEQVKIKIGPVSFDHADHDADPCVLYLHLGEPQMAEGEKTPEGHVLGARRLLDRDGNLTVLAAI